jgi:hypothetical protein
MADNISRWVRKYPMMLVFFVSASGLSELSIAVPAQKSRGREGE